jgi:hypothetical protein
MAHYWNEILDRENAGDIIYQELKQAVRILGVGATLRILAEHALSQPQAAPQGQEGGGNG